MLNISVKHDMKRLAKTLDKKQRKDLPKVIVSALNKTVANVKVAVAKDITASTGIAAAKVKPHLDVRKATRAQRIATITASKRTFNLIRFATPAAIQRSLQHRGTGLKAKAWSKKAKEFPGVFVGNQGRTAFVRTGAGRKIRAAHGPSIPRAMVSAKVAKHTRALIPKRFRINFEHAFKRKFERRR